MTSPYLWLFSLMVVIPAPLWWHPAWSLICCSLIFIAVYIWLYLRIIRFKSPCWMIGNKKN